MSCEALGRVVLRMVGNTNIYGLSLLPTILLHELRKRVGNTSRVRRMAGFKIIGISPISLYSSIAVLHLIIYIIIIHLKKQYLII